MISFKSCFYFLIFFTLKVGNLQDEASVKIHNRIILKIIKMKIMPANGHEKKQKIFRVRSRVKIKRKKPFMKIILLALFVFMNFTLVFSQEKGNTANQFQIDAQKTEMRKLEKMIGKWSGAGWIQQGANREEFTGTENVQRKLDGLALLVEGRFTAKNEPEKIIHETLAVLSYNTKTAIYDFRTYLANGSGGNFTLAATETGYEWGLNFPGNKIVYTITIKDGVWNEIGKVSRDEGKTWFQFFEMNLKKV